MKTSVAICTYNGEKYIESQLLSIINQTIKVDEIVVSDDGSTDKTYEIITKIKETSGANIRWTKNEASLGVCANFDKCIKDCSGDIIFLSDQDDIWMENKVEITLEWFKSNPQKEVAFSNAIFIDENNNRYSDRTLLETVGFSPKAMKHFDWGFQIEALLLHNRCTGAAMAFRSSFVPFLNIDKTATTKNELPLHDFTIALSAASRQVLGYIKQPLIKYRVHASQECGLGEWIKNPPQDDNLIRPLIPVDRFVNYVLPECRERATFGIKRINIRRNKLKVLRNIVNYHKIYGRIAFRPFFYDLLNKHD
ncbi:MAG: glycosyltransferase [Bacteroidales bacterium]|nr:glycosyltransferase [Bacteroidales bacterium]